MAEFSLGQVVVSRKGKDNGTEYVVAGVDGGRILLIRPERFNVSNPKKKNPKHLQGTSRYAQGLTEQIKAGTNIDAGYFHRSVRNGK